MREEVTIRFIFEVAYYHLSRKSFHAECYLIYIYIHSQRSTIVTYFIWV
jgi:hypothetical protein